MKDEQAPYHIEKFVPEDNHWAFLLAAWKRDDADALADKHGSLDAPCRVVKPGTKAILYRTDQDDPAILYTLKGIEP